MVDETNVPETSALPEVKGVEQRWKPLKGNETVELLKIVRRILNKLTPQNYVTLCTQFLQIPIESHDALSDVIDLIIYKAVNEPANAKVYANLCKVAAKIEVDEEKKKANFRTLLILKLQAQFEKHIKSIDKVQEEKNKTTDPDEEEDYKERILRTGNVRLIGELYKLNMLTQTILFRIINLLINENGDVSLECLAVLMKTVGKTILFGPVCNAYSSDRKELKEVELVFKKILEITRRKKESKVSTRVRFMLQDVIDLRKNNWKLRGENNCLKTIDEIMKELKEDSLEISLCYKYSHLINMTSNLQLDADSKGVNSTGTVGDKPSDDDGWTSVISKNNRHKTVDCASSTTQMEPAASNKKNNIDKSKSIENLNDDVTKSRKSGKKNKSAKGSQAVLQPSAANQECSDTKSTVGPINYQKMIAVSFDPSKLQIKPQEKPPQNATKCEPSKCLMSMDEVQMKLLKLMKEKKPYNQIVNFILENVGGRLEEPQFVDVLITAICESCISGSNKFNQVHFKCYEKLIKRFLKNKEGREVASLNVIHNLVLRLKHPGGLIAFIFNLFLLNNLITKDSFLKWRDDDQKLEQKAISLSNLKSFYSRLETFQAEKKSIDCTNKSLDGAKNTSPPIQLSMDQVQQELTKLMKEKKQFNQILNFISNNVDDKVENLNFTGALVSAFCEACISDSSLDQINFKRYEKLIKRFVTNNESRETESLNTVYNFVLRLNHPEGLITNIFTLLLDDNLVSTESFIKWKENNDSKEKGISLSALSSFFSALGRAESGETK